MDKGLVEKAIIKKFSDAKDCNGIVGETLAYNHFELKKILQILGSPSNKKILDVGAGKGRFCRKIKDAGFNNIIGVEPSEELVKRAKELNKDIDFRMASATSLPFSDDYFDYLLYIEVLEHVPDIEMALVEMRRVLKPGGKVIIIDKNIFSLHPVYFVPTALWKKYLEVTDRWFYPQNFPFKEIYFRPFFLKKSMKKDFTSVRVSFIQKKIFVEKKLATHKELILRAHTLISSTLHMLLPFLDMFFVIEASK